MIRQSLRDRIVANVRKLDTEVNAVKQAPKGETKSQAPRTVTLFAG
ncbi:hypothetical protein L6V77_23800 [Myxococcota bacterium]|jgi:hypothetical protein|nr:hypothetical protein [Myxococcota bacterium]